MDGELGDRGLTLRASDSMNNVATTHVDAPPQTIESTHEHANMSQSELFGVLHCERGRERRYGFSWRQAADRAAGRRGALLRRQRHVERGRRCVARTVARSTSQTACCRRDPAAAAAASRSSRDARHRRRAALRSACTWPGRRVTAAARSTVEVRQAAVPRHHRFEREDRVLLRRLVRRAGNARPSARGSPTRSARSLPDSHSSGVASTLTIAASESGRSSVANRIMPSMMTTQTDGRPPRRRGRRRPRRMSSNIARTREDERRVVLRPSGG